MKVGPGSPAVLRQMNRRMVLSTVLAEGPLSRAELKKLTQLSRPTINEVVGELLDEEWLVDEDPPADRPKGRRRPGPPPRVLRFRSERGCVIGIDVGAKKLLVVAADLAGTVWSTARFPTESVHNGSELLDLIHRGIKTALGRSSKPPKVYAAVLSTPGVVDPETGEVTLAPQLRDWEQIQPVRTIAEFLGRPVEGDNEMRLAVVGERWLGAASGKDSVVYLGLGVGVGAGIMIKGELLKGAHWAAGEIGYLPIPAPAEASVRAGFGPLERAVGARSLIESARALARSGNGLLAQPAGGDPEKVTEAMLFEAARYGDAESRRVIAEWMEPLARAIATLVLVVDPQVIVIGGGLSGGGEAFLEPLRSRVLAMVPYTGVEIVQSTLGDQAAALGAVRRAVDMVAGQLFDE